MKIDIDTSEVRELAVEFRQVPDLLARHAKPIVSKGANNIKNQLREEMAGSTWFKRAAGRINYDLIDGGFGAEIGPESAGAGSLANLAYFGGANGGGGTVPDPRGALEAEAPKFEQALAKLAAELLG